MHLNWRLIAAACALSACLPSFAQQYPAKPVRIVVAYPAGGSVDVTARLCAQKFTESTGHSFIVENRAGAGGNTGTEAVARKTYDMLLEQTTLYSEAHFDALKRILDREEPDYAR